LYRMLLCYFFFSSRRRHTRFSRDWRDVCSSDLVMSDGTTVLGSDDKAGLAALIEGIRVLKEQNTPHGTIQLVITAGEESGLVGRSEERRVGKGWGDRECGLVKKE